MTINCPFCYAPSDDWRHPGCKHWIGYTTDGRTVSETVTGTERFEGCRIEESDVIVTTVFATARVYRPEVAA